VTYGANGVDKGTEVLTGSREWSWLEQVGNDVRIRAVSNIVSDTTTMVVINVNNFQQAMQFTGQITPANLGVAAEASISVPQLNRFGERE
jgi:serine kinase of HPr protein (carbohydrate metabolism regulator)